MGTSTTKLTPKEDGRRVVVDGTDCHMEVNGIYVETSELCDGKPQFVNTELHKDRAQVVLSWHAETQRWTIRKLVFRNPGRRVYYIASAATGADVAGDMPPTHDWAASGIVDNYYKAYIQALPRLKILADGDAVSPSCNPSKAHKLLRRRSTVMSANRMTTDHKRHKSGHQSPSDSPKRQRRTEEVATPTPMTNLVSLYIPGSDL